MIKTLHEALDETELGADMEGADPTEFEDNTNEPQAPEDFTSEAEKFYVQLLPKAFAHNPTPNELKIITDVVAAVGDTDPKAITAAIQKMLEIQDSGLRNDLNELN